LKFRKKASKIADFEGFLSDAGYRASATLWNQAALPAKAIFPI